MAYVIVNELQPLRWYIDRIGKRVYRGMSDTQGVKIIDKAHAVYLCSISRELNTNYIEK